MNPVSFTITVPAFTITVTPNYLVEMPPPVDGGPRQSYLRSTGDALFNRPEPSTTYIRP